MLKYRYRNDVGNADSSHLTPAPSPRAGEGIICLFMKLEQTLKDYGLKEKQIKVYLACLQLGTGPVVKIAQKFMFELESKLLAQHIELTTASGVLEFIAKQGFDPKLGARPIARYIDEHIKRKLSHKILFEEISFHRKVRLIIKNNVLDFEIDD